MSPGIAFIMNQRGGEVTLRHTRGSKFATAWASVPVKKGQLTGDHFSLTRDGDLLDRVTVELALGGESELGEVAVADDAAELPLGFEHAGGRPSECHLARAPVLDVAARAADALDHRLARVCRGERALQRARDPEAGERERLLDPLAQRGCRAGGSALKL